MTFPKDQVGGAATRKWVALVFTAVLAIVVAVLTLFPVSLPKPVAGGPDKLYHFVAFLGLMLPTSVLYPRALVWVIPFALIFGGAIELLQPFVNRSGEWADLFADAWGIGAGALNGTLAHKFLTSKSHGFSG